MTAADARLAATRMAEHAGHVFDLAAARLETLPPAVAERVRGLLDARAGLLRRFAPVTDLAISIPRIRVHGDYHLGQVLLGEHDDDVFVIDFEGEPGRSLEERRAKTAAAKDVAGMCRSFDYLLRHAAKTAGTPYDAALLRRLEGSFLDAYRAGAAGGTWWPRDRPVADRLLAIFKLDKAIYELAYELANRPDWIDVPLAALEETLATGEL
jgi:maltose alpha-D-glucosyltransferase/alpha-amylase